MPRRGSAQLKAICDVVRAFGVDAEHLVVFGSCALALYARNEAPSPIRTTQDVDCLCLLSPFGRLQRKIEQLCEGGVITPSAEVYCRYHIRSTGTTVDIVDLEGHSAPSDPWLSQGAAKAQPYQVAEGIVVKALTPPYFLAAKLIALNERGDEFSTDAEDIVTLAAEVADLSALVRSEGIQAHVGELFRRDLRHLNVSIEDLVIYHLHPAERRQLRRVVEELTALAGSAPTESDA